MNTSTRNQALQPTAGRWAATLKAEWSEWVSDIEEFEPGWH
jgi:hypothetical protein